MIMNGKVEWFDQKKGYGFVVADGVDYFVHYKEIVAEGFKTLDAGDNVEFTPFEDSRGMKAKNVKLIASVFVS